jgi:hypothetical protein
MKNVFKFLGIALLASSLVFASCGKDEETETPGTENNGGNNNGGNGGNNNGGDNGGGTNAGVTIALGTVANYTTPQDSLVAYNGQANAVIIASRRSAHWTDATHYSMYFPFAEIQLPTVVGQYDTSSANLQFNEGNFYQTGNAQLQDYPDWILSGNMNANVTAFNATTLTITATASGEMLNQYQGFADYSAAVNAGTAQQGAEALQQFMDAAPRATMTATITSVKLKDMGKGIAKGTARM